MSDRAPQVPAWRLSGVLTRSSTRETMGGMLNIDLTGRRALIAGVADDSGFGFAIAKALAEAGATICLATWPPCWGSSVLCLSGASSTSRCDCQTEASSAFERIWPMDADFDSDADVPSAVREHRRYRDCGDFSIAGLTDRLRADFGETCLDIVVHSMANGPEVKKRSSKPVAMGTWPRWGRAAFPSPPWCQRLGPLVRPGGSFLALSYLASQRVVSRLRGGMFFGQGRAGKRRARARLRGWPQVGPARERESPPAPGPRAQPAPSARSKR